MMMPSKDWKPCNSKSAQ